MPALRLSGREQEQFRSAQEAFLSPIVSKNSRHWQLRSNRAVRRFVGADHSGFILPTHREDLASVVTDDIDPSFPDRLLEYLRGSNGPYYDVADPYVEQAVRARVDGGPDGYHLDELLTLEQQAKSELIQTVFVPAGLPAMIGLSYPLPEGEATQFLGFESRNADGYKERGLQKLRLLIPAFIAGVRTYRRWMEGRKRFLSMLDELDQPLALYDVEGSRVHQNPPLESLLGAEPFADRLEEVLDELARAAAHLGRASKTGQSRIHRSLERRVEGRRVSYRLSALYGPGGPKQKRRILVQIQALGRPLPSPASVSHQHGLTPREATVALLLAGGLSDKAIARQLDISWHTVRTHVRNILRKLGLSSRRKVGPHLRRQD